MLSFCIYEKGQRDYWGEMEDLKDICEFLPDFVAHEWLRSDLSNDIYAHYVKGNITVVVSGW